jgi:hypothetical protein
LLAAHGFNRSAGALHQRNDYPLFGEFLGPAHHTPLAVLRAQASAGEREAVVMKIKIKTEAEAYCGKAGKA